MITNVRKPVKTCNHYYLRHVLINLSHLSEQNLIDVNCSTKNNFKYIGKYRQRNPSALFRSLSLFVSRAIAFKDFYLPGYIYILYGFFKIIFVIILQDPTIQNQQNQYGQNSQPQTFAKKDPKNQPRLGYWFFKNL